MSSGLTACRCRARRSDATAPTTTVFGLHLADDTGIDGDFVTTVAGQTLSGTLSAPLGVGERLFGSADSGTTWTDVTAMVSGTNLGWSGITLAGNNSLQLRVTDAAGNVGPTATQGYTLDTSPPLATTPVTTPVATTTDPNTPATTVGIPATDPTTPTNPLPAPAAINTVYRFFDSTHGTQFLTHRPDMVAEGTSLYAPKVKKGTNKQARRRTRRRKVSGGNRQVSGCGRPGAMGSLAGNVSFELTFGFGQQRVYRGRVRGDRELRQQRTHARL